MLRAWATGVMPRYAPARDGGLAGSL